ncbi:MAG: SMC-Scp complex subunit ScpB [Bacteroidetes bacterium]|nr:SMC-Scp complex subunit ScpB [Bacteroidota bacterium]MBU1422327.1 SMC-Scp complex subunit ScpB [Bacteroidota bacterium]MBU2471066.1 SMC-Scp complex subunit ScpB [Bacteroidota bacterium]MBU2636878.1 SMC-Scp complex subunit ScpB [Bacteroidota bacterium]
MEYVEKKRIIEAIIFASDEPLSLKELENITRSSEEPHLKIKLSEDEILNIVRELNAEYVSANRSFRIVQVAGGFQFATLPDFADWLGLMAKEKAKRKLSQSALESLAVIAYKQPVTKPEIEAIRGVNVDYIIGTLLERDLITIVGRSATPGRPLLYGTTKTFLKHFGINDLIDLPKPREIDEILSDTTFEVEKELLKRMGKSAPENEEQPTDEPLTSEAELQTHQPQDSDNNQ